MRIRSYSKRELAMMYFPNLTPHAATNKLARWIAHCDELSSKLRAIGYAPQRRFFSSKEVMEIVESLGEP